MAANQLAIAQTVYDWLGLPFDEHLQRYLEKEFHGGMDAEASQYTAIKWRTMLEFPVVAKIQEICADIFEPLGLQLVTKENIKDLQFSVVNEKHILQPN